MVELAEAQADALRCEVLAAQRQALHQAHQPLTLAHMIEAECLTRHAARLRARAVALAEAHAVALAG